MTTREALEAARERIIDPRGWCKGRLDDHAGRVCAVGAIGTVTVGRANISHDDIRNPDLREAVKALSSVLPRLHVGSSWDAGATVTSYNDSQPHECVIAAFDAAIEAAPASLPCAAEVALI